MPYLFLVPFFLCMRNRNSLKNTWVWTRWVSRILCMRLSLVSSIHTTALRKLWFYTTHAQRKTVSDIQKEISPHQVVLRKTRPLFVFTAGLEGSVIHTSQFAGIFIVTLNFASSSINMSSARLSGLGCRFSPASLQISRKETVGNLSFLMGCENRKPKG